MPKSKMPNSEFNEMIRKRMTEFAVKLIRFLATVPFNTATKVLSFQLGKAGTSFPANHRAFCRSRSQNERFAKICIVVEEADETQFWLEIFRQTKYGDQIMLSDLIAECAELLAITTSTKDNLYQR